MSLTEGIKSKEFEMFNDRVRFTDDSVMTIAVAEALLDIPGEADHDTIRRTVIASMQKWGNKYPHAGYGQRFYFWLGRKDPKPYGSWGNGSAMDFEDVIRTAVSLGGDCDPLTCIAGSIAEAFCGVPEEMKEECRKRLSPEMLEVLDRFEERVIAEHAAGRQR